MREDKSWSFFELLSVVAPITSGLQEDFGEAFNDLAFRTLARLRQGFGKALQGFGQDSARFGRSVCDASATP